MLAGSWKPDRERADALIERANASLARLALDEALSLLTEAITILTEPIPKQYRLDFGPGPLVKALCNRAYCLEQLGRIDEALADAHEANSISPTVKGCLRAGRALICLDRFEEACNELNAAAERQPALATDRQLLTLLNDAEWLLQQPDPPAARIALGKYGSPRVAVVAAAAAAPAAAAADAPPLASPYYYAAVPQAQHTLPVAPPARLPSQPNASAHAATGAIAADIARRGGGSYYYAHDRVIDHAEPVVPKRIDADGNLVSADLS